MAPFVSSFFFHPFNFSPFHVFPPSSFLFQHTNQSIHFACCIQFSPTHLLVFRSLFSPFCSRLIFIRSPSYPLLVFPPALCSRLPYFFISSSFTIKPLCPFLFLLLLLLTSHPTPHTHTLPTQPTNQQTTNSFLSDT